MNTDIFEHAALSLPGTNPLVYTAFSKHYFYYRMYISRYVLEQGCVPLNPFMLFDYFLLDSVDRDLIRDANNSVVLRADQIWVFGPISNGVLTEILLAKKAHKPISYFGFEKPHRIVPITENEVTMEDEVQQFKSVIIEKENYSTSGDMYKVVVDYAPAEADNAVVREGIIAFNENIVGERDKAFSIFLKNDLGKVFGGIQAFLGTESVYIDVLWVEGNLQKQGYGTKLLDAVEREAIKNGCVFSLVDTWDFQAEEFYLKNGYERIGELKNYWLGHSKIFLRKNLRQSSESYKERQL